MTISITLTSAGIDTGPFNLFSDVDGYTTAFVIGVSRTALMAGYETSTAPNGTTTVRVRSTGTCSNSIDIILTQPTTTTSTTTAAPTTTSTTTAAPTTTSTTTAAPTTTSTTTAAPTFTTHTIYIDAQGDGWIDSPTACAATATGPITLYTNPASTTFQDMITNGHAFFTDQGLTTAFNGDPNVNGERWYKSQSAPGGTALRIDGTGFIDTALATC